MFGNKDKKEKRFIIKEEQGLAFGGIYIILDTVTGVNYITTSASGPTGITPLLDKDGKVVIDLIKPQE